MPQIEISDETAQLVAACLQAGLAASIDDIIRAGIAYLNACAREDVRRDELLTALLE